MYSISDLYDELVAAAKGEVRAKITTAQGLEPAELEDIKDGLSMHCQNELQHAWQLQTRINAAVLCITSKSASLFGAAEELLKPGEKLLVEQQVSVAAKLLA